MIDDVKVESPTEYQVDVEPIGSFRRNADGKFTGDLITTKQKLTCSWSVISSDSLSHILLAVRKFYFKVKYLDPILKDIREMDVYVSPQTTKLLLYMTNNTYYKDVTIEFIER